MKTPSEKIHRRTKWCTQKDNGSEVPLGILNNDSFREVSAVVFSTTATWGKLAAMTKDASEHAVNLCDATAPNPLILRRRSFGRKTFASKALWQ